MKFILCIWNIFFIYNDVRAIEETTTLPPLVKKLLGNLSNDTRRIINGDEITDEMPFMVYLKLPSQNPKEQDYRSWLCGGTIIHEEYILTSAACIEDANHFYVISGTFNYADEADKFNSACIKNGAKKAVWKCVPKNYVFDGHENDNIRWMNNDIAVVKIEDGFDFTRRIRGCDFVPKPVCYNNQSQTLENPGTMAQIAGWGSTERYHEFDTRRRDNQRHLLASLVEIIVKNRCKRRWGARYHNIIDNYMICSKDLGQTMTEVCNEKYVDCSDISYDADEDLRKSGVSVGPLVMKTERIPTNLQLHSAYHNETRRLKGDSGSGGFCENDHGGPMIVGTGVNSIVVGVISACLVKERSNKCYGPFLYTSVYKNRQFIACAVYKELEPKCRRQFRSGLTHSEHVMSWKNHPDGPANNELEPGVKPKKRLYATTTTRHPSEAITEDTTNAITGGTTEAILPTDNIEVILMTDNSEALLPTDDAEARLPTYDAESIITTDYVEARLPSANAEAILPTNNKGTILPTDNIGTILPTDNAASGLPTVNTGAVLPTDNKEAILPTDNRKPILPTDNTEVLLPTDNTKAVSTADSEAVSTDNTEVKLPTDNTKAVSTDDSESASTDDSEDTDSEETSTET